MLPKEERELRERLGEQIRRNLVYWAERLRDREDYVHVRTVGTESGEVTEAWFTVFHLGLLNPRRPSPEVQFFYYPVADDEIVDYTGVLQADMSEGTAQVSGATLDIARAAALTDPTRAEVVETVSGKEFAKLRKREG